MSSTDDRIVRMHFDNDRFEKNAKDTLRTLGDLKKGLDLKGATRSLDQVSASARNFSLGGITSGVDHLSRRFTALGIVGMTTIQNLTNSAVNAGRRIINSLTIDPVTTGFSEYELKMGSIQTIMASTGEELPVVNAYLEDLNTYSDRTIYSFSDMTNNIGKFTNAGVKLETAVNAIKGVSNVAALSGASSEEASRAMFNFSQALSKGYVELIDWRSIDLANMGTIEFKQQLIDTAVALGVVTKASDGYYKTKTGKKFNAAENFNDVLREQWLTTEVLTTTLGRYADETTDIGKRSYAAAQDIKTFSQLYDTLKEAAQSGWAMSWEIIIGDFEEAKSMLTLVNEAISEVIETSADSRNALLSDWKVLGGRADLMEGVAIIWNSFSDISRSVREAFADVFPPMTGERLSDLTEGFKELAKRFEVTRETAYKVKVIFRGIFTAVDLVRSVIWETISGAGELAKAFAPRDWDILGTVASFSEYITTLSESVNISKAFQDTVTSLKDHIVPLDELIDRINSRFELVLPFFQTLGDKIGRIFGKLSSVISETFGKFDPNQAFKFAQGGIFTAILFGIKQFVDTINDVVGDKGLFGNIVELLDGVRDSLMAYQQSLKAKALLNIALAIGVLAVALVILGTIDPDRLTASLHAVAVMLIELVLALSILSNVRGGLGVAKLGLLTTALIGLSTALLILAVAMKIISGLDPVALSQGLQAVGIMLAMLVGVMVTLSKTNTKMIKGAFGVILFAGAILLLVQAVKMLGDIEPYKLTNGLIGLGVVLLELALFMKITNFSKLGPSTGAGLILVAGALMVLAKVVEKFGNLDVTVLFQGLAALGIVLTQLALFTVVAGGKKLVSAATGLLIISGALVVFTYSIEKLGNMPLEILQKGIGAIAVSLIVLAGAMYIMRKGLLGAVALTIVTTALLGLVHVIKTLGNMETSSIIKGLLTLAGMFAIIGIAALVLAPAVGAILLLSGALLVLGVAIATIGAGVLLLATGLSILSVAGVGAAAAIVAIVVGVVGLIPYIAEQVGIGIMSILDTLNKATPKILTIMKKVLLGLVKLAVDTIPPLVNAFATLIVEVLNVLAEKTPDIINAGVNFVVAFITGITNELPRLIDAGVKMIIGFLQGLAVAIEENSEEVNEAVIELVDVILRSIIDFIKQSYVKLKEAGVYLFDTGFLEGIKSTIGDILSKIVSIPRRAVEQLRAWIADFFDAGEYLASGFSAGMYNYEPLVQEAGESLGETAVNATKKKTGVKSPSTVFMAIGRHLAEGLVLGMGAKDKDITEAAGDMGDKAKKGLKGALSHLTDLLESDIDIQPVIQPIVDMSIVEKGIDSTFNKSYSLIPERSGMLSTSAYRRVTNIDAAKVEANIDTQEVRVTHDGRIRVEGVTNEGQVVAVKDLLIEEIRNGDRRLPNRTSIYPFG